MYCERTPDDGQRHSPKHVEFHAKNKICEISASSWFYYKEICYDAQSHERKKNAAVLFKDCRSGTESISKRLHIIP